MQSILESVFEYQSLLARHTHLGLELDDEERARFLGLRQLLRGEWLETDDKRRGSRFPEHAQVEFTTPGGFGAGTLKDVCGGGMAVVSDVALRPGMRTVLRVQDEERASEYIFPCRIVWRAGQVIGVAFDGVPSRTGWGPWPGEFRFDRKRAVPSLA
ncbi:MAG: PilZ domain-containing protein [Polyangiales bacterium]